MIFSFLAFMLSQGPSYKCCDRRRYNRSSRISCTKSSILIYIYIDHHQDIVIDQVDQGIDQLDQVDHLVGYDDRQLWF